MLFYIFRIQICIEEINIDLIQNSDNNTNTISMKKRECINNNVHLGE